jgi:CheY-like chemotaxis protein
MTADNAVKAEPKPHDIRALKVLVAEDSSITSDLLKLLLGQRGHHVDIVTDGLQH